MFKTISRPFFFCVSQSLPCCQGLFWADNVKYQLRAKSQRIVCLWPKWKGILLETCLQMCTESVSFQVFWWHGASGTGAISALPSYLQRWDPAFFGSVCLLFPALRFLYLHLFLPFVSCVLPFPLCVTLGRAMKGVAAASHWVIRWGTNGSLDLRASRSPLFLEGASVKLGWLAVGSRRFPPQIPGEVSGFLPVKWCSSEIRSSLWSTALLGGTAKKVPFPLACSIVSGCPWALWHLFCFQVEPGVQPLGPASEEHENFPPKNPVTNQETSKQIQQLVSCEPGLGEGMCYFLIFVGGFTCAIQVEILGTEVFLRAVALQKWEAWGIRRKTQAVCMQSVAGQQLQVLGCQGNMSHSNERETCQ